ncbi:hypothetical protein GWD52_04570 [Enterobacteriaceae bacterium 4M9]|nr:hypothetical protein [Enterobacteriaceae bacterium 4M9]
MNKKITNCIKKLCSAFIITFSLTGIASAVPYYWPVIYNITMEDVRLNWAGNTVATATIYWHITHRDDDFGARGISQVQNYGFVFVSRNPASFGSIGDGPGVDCMAARISTVAKCLAEFVRQNGAAGSFTTTLLLHDELCVLPTMGKYYSGSAGLDPETPNGTSRCYKPAPPEEYCNILNKEITFDYGTVLLEKKDTAKSQATINIECTSDNIVYNLKTVLDDDLIPLSNGMHASIELNSSSISSRIINGKKGNESFQLESHLHGTPSQTGIFTGTSIIYINYQ